MCILRANELEFPKNIVFLSPKIDFVSANSADSDEMPHDAFSCGCALSARIPVKGFLVYTGLNVLYFCFVCFVALRPKSTAMVIAGRSVHLTTLFSWASLNKQLTSNRAHTFACN